jgi:hypothetical protein
MMRERKKMDMAVIIKGSAIIILDCITYPKEEN